MDEIFANAKSILVVWLDDNDPENLPKFQDTLQMKSKQAQIAFENVQMLLECKSDRSIDRLIYREYHICFSVEMKSSTCYIII